MLLQFFTVKNMGIDHVADWTNHLSSEFTKSDFVAEVSESVWSEENGVHEVLPEATLTASEVSDNIWSEEDHGSTEVLPNLLLLPVRCVIVFAARKTMAVIRFNLKLLLLQVMLLLKSVIVFIVKKSMVVMKVYQKLHVSN